MRGRKEEEIGKGRKEEDFTIKEKGGNSKRENQHLKQKTKKKEKEEDSGNEKDNKRKNEEVNKRNKHRKNGKKFKISPKQFILQEIKKTYHLLEK